MSAAVPHSGPNVLPAGMPAPVPAADGLDAPYWEGTAAHELRVQRCRACGTWQWGPEWLCHACHSFDVGYEAVAPHGLLYAYERVWHPVTPVLAAAVPYVVALVVLPHAGGVRMVGNLVGDPLVDPPLDGPVTAVFEDHPATDTTPAYTLVHWRAG